MIESPSEIISEPGESTGGELLKNFDSKSAHELNGLLAGILDHLSKLRGHTDPGGAHTLQEPLSAAIEAADKAVGIVRQFTGTDTKVRLKKSGVDTVTLISELTSLFEKRSPDTLQIYTGVKEEIWQIDIDESQIVEVLSNIFENSLHATGGVGTLNITARNFVLSDQSLSEAFECEPGHYVILTIADDGIGMTEDGKSRAFEPYFSTKESGERIGLGLAHARRIVREHGGHISCTSAEKQGTAFSLYLPRHQSVDPRQADQTAQSDPRSPAVLVVEDEGLIRSLVQTLCEKNGYRTFGATDGIEALEYINNNPDEIFAVVLDIAMPRMTGTELFREMNNRGINLPVIIASGFLVDPQKFMAETGGTPYAIFSKPYQLSELILKINELRDQAGLIMAS